MTDRIEVRGLRVLGTHGVLPEERVRAQPFEVDLDLDVVLARAADTDELGDTVDYGEVVDRVVDVVGGTRSYRLLETLAGVIAADALIDERVESVTVSVRKLHPPLAADVASVGVRITRNR
ncbi:MAG: dihydroneopterin aldolase [Acidimicrobiales bacterium]|jgi:dihydroneopterin aldolase